VVLGELSKNSFITQQKENLLKMQKQINLVHKKLNL